MASFAVEMHRLQVEAHPKADRLEIAVVMGYKCVVPKGMYKTGDLAAYIPEQAIVPKSILEEMGLVGKLGGKEHDRVSAQRLRGVLSQGLIYSGKQLDGWKWKEGADCTELLGVTKYEPVIPQDMRGKVVRYGGDDKLASYDVENIKNHPGRLQEGEPVTMHEKVHGVLCYCAVRPYESITVSSKGWAASQLVFADGVDNIYTRMAGQYEHDLYAIAKWLRTTRGKDGDDGPVHVFCEIYGRDVQDLHYGADLDMAVFDVMLSDGTYVTQSDIDRVRGGLRLRQAPLAYEGPFSLEALEEHTSGPSLVPGADHIREGVVVRPVPERDDMQGRVMLKSVSPKYLVRGGGTEYS